MLFGRALRERQLDEFDLAQLPTSLQLDVLKARLSRPSVANERVDRVMEAQSALARARSYGDPTRIVELWTLLVHAQLMAGDSRVVPEGLALVAWAETADVPPLVRGLARLVLASALSGAGDLRQARAVLRETVPSLSGRPDLVAHASITSGNLDRALGRADRACVQLEETYRQMVDRRQLRAQVDVGVAWARAAAEAEQLDTARDLAATVLPLAQDLGGGWQPLALQILIADLQTDPQRAFESLSALAEAATHAGRRGLAAEARLWIAYRHHAKGALADAVAGYQAALPGLRSAGPIWASVAEAWLWLAQGSEADGFSPEVAAPLATLASDVQQEVMAAMAGECPPPRSAPSRTLRRTGALITRHRP